MLSLDKLLPQGATVRASDIAAATNVRTMDVYRWVRKGTLPKPVLRISRKVQLWDRAAVLAALEKLRVRQEVPV